MRRNRPLKPAPGKKRGHTISLLSISGFSKRFSSILGIFKSKTVNISSTPSALFAVLPRDLDAFYSMNNEIKKTL